MHAWLGWVGDGGLAHHHICVPDDVPVPVGPDPGELKVHPDVYSLGDCSLLDAEAGDPGTVHLDGPVIDRDRDEPSFLIGLVGLSHCLASLS